jgi:hypothetical protein
MALDTPTWLQNGTYTARLDRIFADILFTEGVMRPGAGELLVTQRGAGANNSVDIAAGYACIEGDDAADQGNYMVRNTATVNLAATAAPVSNSRIDLVCLRVNDPAEGGPVGDNAEFVYVTGTAAPSPAVPATPTSAIALARVLRTVGDTAVVTANITDVRPQSLTILSNTLTTAGDLFSFDGSNAIRVPLGTTGLPLVAGATSVGYAQVGTGGLANLAVTDAKLAANAVTTAKITDLNVTGAKIANATIGAAKMAAEAWVAYVPTCTNVTNTTNTGRYRQIGKDVHFWARCELTGSSVVSGTATISLPVTAQAGVISAQFTGYHVDSGSLQWHPAAVIASSTTSVQANALQVSSPDVRSAAMTSSVPFTWTTGDAIEISGTYEAA